MIPYSHQVIDDDDVAAVEAVLRSDWLTQGPNVVAFESALAKYTGASYAVVMSSGTAALHAAYVAIGLGPGDEFITSPMTFAATTNAGVWQGARPVFVDIEKETGNLDPRLVEAVITPRTKAIVPVDYTGRPADLTSLKSIAEKYKLALIEDACQAIGAEYYGRKIGAISDLTILSFHPVKNITTGEGGAVLTDNESYYRTMKKFVNHGMTKDDLLGASPGAWYMEMHLLGLNYRLTDLQAALGLSQLKKIDRFIAARRRLVERYNEAFAGITTMLIPSLDTDDIHSAWHLYVIRLTGLLADKRTEIFTALRTAGIGVQVHHIPVHYHPFYRRLGYHPGLTPRAEAWYASCISLPLYPSLTEAEQEYIINEVKKLVV